MNIEKKEDIIVPQKVIGIDQDWEDEIYPIIEACSGGDISPTSEKEIAQCEKTLGTSLPPDLKLFYLKFGPAQLSEKLFPVEEFCYLTANWDKEMLSFYTKEEQEVLSKLIVFGDYLGNGNVWCFHKDTKHIFFFIHDSKPNINGMFDDFYGYLQPLLVYSQAELGEEEKFDELYSACEEICIDLIGKDRVRVWQYYLGWD